ncbi:MAG: NADH-quinone oxidoreductase subunit NuoB [Akkermansia sp.]|nr:NADH-quinone oxidoreductase subunit NuoB [Akkermansia sp.]
MCDPDADGGFVYTTVEAAINWMHKYSMWPMPMGTSCCAIEYMAASCSRYDISRFGAEVNRYAPRQADFMFICGTNTYKMAALVRRIWDQMPAPKWCIACGACACTGGMFRSYSVLQGVDKIVPVDVYISGCPPRPEALLQGLITLQDKIMATDHPLKGFFKEHDLRQAQNAHTIPAGIITQD